MTPVRIRPLVALLCILLAGGVGLETARSQPTTVLRGGQLFDATDTTLTDNPGIVVRAGKIVDRGATALDTAGARIVRLGPDHVILPGLVDLHAHYAVDFFGAGRVEETEGYPLLYLANGATTTFTAGEMQPDKMRRVRRAIARGDRIGPRMLTSGPYFGKARPGWDTTRTPASIRREVDRWAARGVEHFKAKRLQAELLRALIDQAHRHGATVTGHLGSGSGQSVNPRTAIDMGIDRIEHFLGGAQLPDTAGAYDALPTATPDEPAFDRIARHFREHNVYFDATISAYGYYGTRESDVYADWPDAQQYFTPYLRSVLAEEDYQAPVPRFQRIFELKLDRIKAFYEAGGGGLITLGTDHPSWGEYLAPFGVHRELQAFVRAGIPEAAALRIATINGARAVGRGDRLGTLTVGKWADLFVVRGNPLADIRNTRNVEWVMVRGDLHRAAALREAARGTVGPDDAAAAEAFKPDRGP
ncbi:amidohydrolase family protein [Salinibacter ruber]|uniref:amidohydrolase family protein n=1 Tax=Salinibacter ruber TaxID=146919 RepID=UPI0021D16807|nr:amidohydrolase family protein [Salinibacter ruber]